MTEGKTCFWEDCPWEGRWYSQCGKEHDFDLEPPDEKCPYCDLPIEYHLE